MPSPTHYLYLNLYSYLYLYLRRYVRRCRKRQDNMVWSISNVTNNFICHCNALSHTTQKSRLILTSMYYQILRITFIGLTSAQAFIFQLKHLKFKRNPQSMFPRIGLRGQLAISSPIWCPQPGTIVSDRWRKSERFYAERIMHENSLISTSITSSAARIR